MLSPLNEELLGVALLEDLPYGDLTTDSLFQSSKIAFGVIRSRQSAIISGLYMMDAVFHKMDPAVRLMPCVNDGDAVTSGTDIIRIEGPIAAILKGERLALNFLQHLSGIATLTFQYVGAVSGTKAKIAHTRKTIPGLRDLAIRAVLDGGGAPHRKSLSQAVLIKDNHIAAMGGIRQAVEKVRQHVGHMVTIEVECDTLAQLEEAVDAGVQTVLLDNMSLDMLKKSVHIVAGRAVVEASGGVTLSTVYDIAKTGVDIISTSQITMSAPAIDVGLDFL